MSAPFTGFPRSGAQNAAPAGTNILTAASTDARYNFEKIFSGQVMSYFEEASVFLPLHSVITIDHGKSASFAYVGRVGSSYLYPGEEINSKDIRTAEQIISVDSKLASFTFVNDMDEMMNHFGLRDRYATELSGALVRKFDRRVSSTLIRAARCVDSSHTNGWSGTTTDPEDSTKQYGTQLRNGLMATDAQTLIDQILKAAQTFEEKDVVSAARYCALRPAQHYMLVGDRTALNKDWGGSGGLASGTLPEIGGIKLVKSNHIPSTDNQFSDASTTAEVNDYRGDFTGTVGVIFTPDAVGTVRLRGMKLETETSVRYQGTLMVASYVQGHGILNPRCSIELSTAASAVYNP